MLLVVLLDLPFLHHPHYNPVHLPLSLCHRFILPLPIRFLRLPRSPPFRHSLTLMATPHAASPDSSQPSTKTVCTHPALYLYSFVIHLGIMGRSWFCIKFVHWLSLYLSDGSLWKSEFINNLCQLVVSLSFSEMCM